MKLLDPHRRPILPACAVRILCRNHPYNQRLGTVTEIEPGRFDDGTLPGIRVLGPDADRFAAWMRADEIEVI